MICHHLCCASGSLCACVRARVRAGASVHLRLLPLGKCVFRETSQSEMNVEHYAEFSLSVIVFQPDVLSLSANARYHAADTFPS